MKDFDHHSEHFRDNKLQVLGNFRECSGLSRSDKHGGFTVVARYSEVREAAQDWSTFSSENDVGIGDSSRRGIMIPPNPVRTGFVERDPPISLEYRRLLTGPFNERNVRDFAPKMQQIVTSCLDEVIESGELDILILGADVASIASLTFIGVPADRGREWGRLFHQLVAMDRTSPEFEQLGTQLGDLVLELGELVAARRKAPPRDDLMNLLLNASISGEPLTDEVVAEIIYMLLAGAVDTSAISIAHVLRHLHDCPADRDRIAKDPSLLPVAIEELLRYHSPFTGAARTVSEDHELAGCPLRRGDRVWLSYAAANHDDSVFPQAASVDISRKPNPHLAFGWGVHRCIGIHFARVEIEVVVKEVLRRIPDYKLDADAIELYPAIGILDGVVSMPARFAPGHRELSPRPNEEAIG